MTQPADRLAQYKGAYGSDTGEYQIGETVYQNADSSDPTIKTGTALVFSASTKPDGTKYLCLFKFGGRDKQFVPKYDIIGETSGAKYWILLVKIANCFCNYHWFQY